VSAEPTAPVDEGAWHRLHPLSPVVRGGRALIALVVIFAPSLFSGRGSGSGHLGDVGVTGAIAALGVVSWLVTRWRVEGADLRIETGLLRRKSSRFPLRQIQAIDTVRPVLARIFGLAELRLRMGSTSGSGRLAYLTVREAERLRAELLELAHGGGASVPASSAQAETVLVSVPPSRLIGSILLTRLGLTVEALGITILVALLVFPAAATAVIGASAAGIFGLLTAFWRRVNGEYNLTLAEASDGLRLRAGLLETTAETIPRGRVQAVRMTEPLLWRPFGWCRLEADIAGRQRKKGENRAQSRQLRALLPVGSREDARRVLGRIIADPPQADLPAPLSARLKSPLRYHHLAWGRTDSCVVATSGRITRTTAWVPLSKLQSLRRVQGPIQRRLGLATVHLDTAGRNIRAALRDRETADADNALVELTALGRIARQSQQIGRRRAPD
jgi:putative membrane protein